MIGTGESYSKKRLKCLLCMMKWLTRRQCDVLHCGEEQRDIAGLHDGMEKAVRLLFTNTSCAG